MDSLHSGALAADAVAVRRTLVPYGLLGLLLALGFGIRYFASGEASRGSKLILAVVLAVSLLISWQYPHLRAVATVLQAGISIYVLIYLKLNPYA